jgi:hypothetical protein
MTAQMGRPRIGVIAPNSMSSRAFDGGRLVPAGLGGGGAADLAVAGGAVAEGDGAGAAEGSVALRQLVCSVIGVSLSGNPYTKQLGPFTWLFVN